MKPEEHIKELFVQAVQKKSSAERRQFLAEACRGQPALRAQVESLLQAHDQAGNFLGQPIQPPKTDASSSRLA